MKLRYSKLLINEIVVPEQGAPWLPTSADVLILSCHVAQERREREWRALVHEAGVLSVRMVWRNEGAGEGLVEVENV